MTRSLRVGHDGSLSAIPLLHAKFRGFFETEGLQIEIVREFGLRSLINRCLEQHLDAACLPAPTPVVQSIHAAHDPLRWTMLGVLSRGGYGLVLNSAAAQRLQRPRHVGETPLRIGIPPTTTCAPLLVRDWHRGLANESIPEPRLSTVPISEMVDFLDEDVVDGFCAPETICLLAMEKKLGQLAASSQTLRPLHLNSVLAAPPRSPFAGNTTRRSMQRALELALAELQGELPAWLSDPDSPWAAQLPDVQQLLQLRRGTMPSFEIRFPLAGSPADTPPAQDHTFIEECCAAFPGTLPHPRLLRKTIEQIYLPTEMV